MNSLDITIIRMDVAFVVGEIAERLLPLARRFVPEPVRMSYIVTHPFVSPFRIAVGGLLVAAYLPRALADAIRAVPVAPRSWMHGVHGDDPSCSIYCDGVGDIRICPLPQVTLQTCLRLPVCHCNDILWCAWF